MGKDPAFLLFSKDFLTGTADLTMEERGQFITMLCCQHQKGICSSKWLSINIPNASADVLAKFDQDEEGNYINRRLEAEMFDRKRYLPKKIAAACLGGLIRSAKLKNSEVKEVKEAFNISDYADIEDEEEIKQKVSEWFKHMLNQMLEANDKPNAKSKRLAIYGDGDGDGIVNGNKEDRGYGGKEIVYPFKSDEFEEAWDMWCAYRRELGVKPYKPIGEQAALMKLSKLARNDTEAIEIIRQSIENGWKGFFEVEQKRKSNGKRVDLADIISGL